MEKEANSGLFVNDGSFMERFKQLQQQNKGPANQEPKSGTNASGTSMPKVVISKTNLAFKVNDSRKSIPAASSGKLAFSLKQKSKLVAPPVKLGEDEDEDEVGNENSFKGAAKRQKLGEPDASEQSLRQFDVASNKKDKTFLNYSCLMNAAYTLSSIQHWLEEMSMKDLENVARCYKTPSFPSDSTVKKVADKLASFVAKNGRQFEHITRQKNPGDTPFKFLFDKSCSDYKYYEYRLSEEEKALSQTRDSQSPQGGVLKAVPNSSSSSQRAAQQALNYQIPASALYEATENTRASGSSTQTSVGLSGESSATSADPLAMMEYYMKKAAQEEKRRPPKASKDEMPPPASLQGGPGKRGHHMGDYIPPEELEKFLATCNDAVAVKAAKEAAERNRIQADNVGHRLLSKMGWREGEGLGSSRAGIADPIMAGDVKTNNLGVGAHQPGEVTPEDDIYEQYKKRMMLGYRYRPNPLNNPRKAYY